MKLIVAIFTLLTFLLGSSVFANGEYAEGHILLSFTDNTPISTAKKTFTSANLRFENYAGTDVDVFVNGRPDKLKQAMKRLSKNKRIKKISTIPNEDRIEIIFKSDATKREVEKILAKEKLQLSANSFFRWSAMYKVYVPKGKEQEYVKRFSKLKSVKSVSTDLLLSIPDCSKGPC